VIASGPTSKALIERVQGDVETLKKENQGAIPVDPATGFMPHHARYVAHVFGFNRELTKQAEDMLPRLYHAFVAKDMSLLEINPLVVTKAGQLICLDAKIAFDDNATFRHPRLLEMRDVSEDDALKRVLVETGRHGDELV